MANAANSPFVKHPALLALFAPRPPPPFKQPMPTKSMAKMTGVAAFLQEFTKEEPGPIEPKNVIKYLTPTEQKEKALKEKEAAHLAVLAEREKKWDPHNNPNSTKDPYKTLFVARLSYELNEEDLRREFERYGRIRDVKLIKDKEKNKSRGYAFIEFERSNDLKEAFQHADGHKLKGRRILVDVERGRTVKTWKPRKLGGGLGKTRAGPKGDKNKSDSLSSARPSSRSNKPDSRDRGRDRDRDRDRGGRRDRDKHRDRDYRDRDRKSTRGGRGDRGDRDRDRGRRDRDKRRSRSRSRDRGNKHPSTSSKRRDRDSHRDRDSRKDTSARGDRDSRKSSRMDRSDRSTTTAASGGYSSRADRTDRGDNKDRGDRRRRRSRSKEKNRSRR